MLYCWKCKQPVQSESNKIGFRAICPHCDRDLHVCVNCRHYAPGKPNDCNVPGTEPIKDREKMNYCEEFEIRKQALDNEPKKEDITKKFNSLFKDE